MVTVAAKSGAKRWTTSDELAFLVERKEEYIKHREGDKRYTNFWPTLDADWFAQFSERERLFPGQSERLLDKQESLLLSTDIDKRRKQLRTWYRNNVKTSVRERKTVAKATILENITKSTRKRHLQPVEVFMLLHYEDMIRHLVREAIENATPKMDKKQIMATIKQIATNVFEVQGEEIHAEVKEKMEELRKPGAPLSEEQSPEDYQRAIDGMKDILAVILGEIARTTGWKFALYCGGPMPMNGGKLSFQSLQYGTSELGHDFSEANCVFHDKMMSRFGKWLATAIPSSLTSRIADSVCKSRALRPDAPAMAPGDMDSLVALEDSFSAAGGEMEDVTSSPMPTDDDTQPSTSTSFAQPPVAKAPVAQPPVTQPLVAQPPVNQPLVAQPPIDDQSPVNDQYPADKQATEAFSSFAEDLKGDAFTFPLFNGDLDSEISAFDPFAGLDGPALSTDDSSFDMMEGLDAYNDFAMNDLAMRSTMAGSSDDLSWMDDTGDFLSMLGLSPKSSDLGLHAAPSSDPVVNAPAAPVVSAAPISPVAASSIVAKVPAVVRPPAVTSHAESATATTAMMAHLMCPPPPPPPVLRPIQPEPTTDRTAAQTPLGMRLARLRKPFEESLPIVKDVVDPGAEGRGGAAVATIPPTISPTIPPTIPPTSSPTSPGRVMGTVGEKPEWFSLALSHIRDDTLGADWSKAVGLWEVMESALNYGDNKHKSALRPKDRPALLSAWVTKRRNYGKIPAVDDRSAYGMACRKWWHTIQPVWRQGEDRLPPAIYVTDSEEGWSTLRVGGQNGFVLVMIAFAWLGRLGCDDVWLALTKDLCCCLERMAYSQKRSGAADIEKPATSRSKGASKGKAKSTAVDVESSKATDPLAGDLTNIITTTRKRIPKNYSAMHRGVPA
ncbi:hypothetical protein PLICRDRAFT_30642 [Plicaturopsis crispa FD-325 SS-3]|nr:hypothetical protein PLICRDRAFT_30642 [Plicaturopsis crispa FD-325 SS-3]